MATTVEQTIGTSLAAIGAYNANATDVKEVAWWHTHWWIWEVAL